MRISRFGFSLSRPNGIVPSECGSSADISTLEARGWGHIVGVFALSILIALLLLGLLVAQDPWKVLAVTRLLDPLIEGGVVQYHDRQPGFIAGVPLPEYYYWSQEAIDWRLVALASVLMMAYPTIKAIQFHVIARSYGSRATFGQNLAAYIYGDGLNRFLPFNMGLVGTAHALMADGLDREHAIKIVAVSRLFVFFEVCVFALIGLWLLGWSSWISHIFWAVAVLAAAYFIVSGSGRSSVALGPSDLIRIGMDELFARAGSNPAFLMTAALLSVLAFGTIEVAIYILMAAFDTTVIAISVDPSVLLMAIVGGYIAARLIPVTPGGIGQWEMGFASTLLLADSDVSIPLLCIGILAGSLRMASGLVLMILVRRLGTVKTRLADVFAAFDRGLPDHAPMTTGDDLDEIQSPHPAFAKSGSDGLLQKQV